MKNISVYGLLVESRVSDNIKRTKRLFNSVLNDTKNDKDLFENQFMVVNENHNIDCTDVKGNFNDLSKKLRESKSLIEEADKQRNKSNLKKANELIKKAHKKLKETENLRESNIDAFHSVVTIAESLEKKNISESVEVADDNFMVCHDCAMAIANDDYTGLDYHYGDKADKREEDIRQSLGRISKQGYQVAMGDSEKDEEFSKKPCESCKDNLAGYRHHAVLLK